MTNPDDPLIANIDRVRNKHFGHFDKGVMNKFVEYQATASGREPFFVGDADGKPLESRFLWPAAATIFDIFPNPSEANRPQRIDALLDQYQEIWAQTGNLIATVLNSWLNANKSLFDVMDGDVLE